jgi:hypothetical protein
MDRVSELFFGFLFVMFLGACATPTAMPFAADSDRVSEKSKPIFLMTANLRNLYRTNYQPRLIVVHVVKEGGRDTADRLNFTIDLKGRKETDLSESGNTYFIRFQLDPGEYDLIGMSSMARSGLILSRFITPLHAKITVKESGVYYLGHITGKIRERVGDEFKAGPSLPLIDQAVGGASGGTFDIEIKDEWSAFEDVFRSRFPALEGVSVKKAVLPPFDRAKAQSRWEGSAE